jgi:hypothetical protein
MVGESVYQRRMRLLPVAKPPPRPRAPVSYRISRNDGAELRWPRCRWRKKTKGFVMCACPLFRCCDRGERHEICKQGLRCCSESRYKSTVHASLFAFSIRGICSRASRRGCDVCYVFLSWCWKSGRSAVCGVWEIWQNVMLTGFCVRGLEEGKRQKVAWMWSDHRCVCTLLDLRCLTSW